MARPLRIEFAGALYHVTSRGNARKPIFRDAVDRRLFLETLKKVNDRYHWLCHAYCLMNNHYHLVIETPDGNLSKGMRQLNGVYTILFNKRHQAVGHVFQGRYKAILVEKERHGLEVCRYVVLNPVRAKVVPKPEGWKWGSYRAMAGMDTPHPCLTTSWILGQFAGRKEKAERMYRAFLWEGIGGRSIWEKVKGQSILGQEGFIDRFVDHVRGYKQIKEIPRSQRYLGRPGLRGLFTDGVFVERGRRDKKIVEAVYRWGYSQKEVAEYLGMHYSTISRLIKNSGQ